VLQGVAVRLIECPPLTNGANGFLKVAGRGEGRVPCPRFFVRRRADGVLRGEDFCDRLHEAAGLAGRIARLDDRRLDGCDDARACGLSKDPFECARHGDRDLRDRRPPWVVGIEVDGRSVDSNRPCADVRRRMRDARPVLGSQRESGLDDVGEHVGNLLEDGLWPAEVDVARSAAVEYRAPPPEMHLQRVREQPISLLEKSRELAARVGDDLVHVVREYLHRVELEPELGREDRRDVPVDRPHDALLVGV